MFSFMPVFSALEIIFSIANGVFPSVIILTEVFTASINSLLIVYPPFISFVLNGDLTVVFCPAILSMVPLYILFICLLLFTIAFNLYM